jgi:hypothetical protein
MSALTTYLLARPNIRYLGNTDAPAGTTSLADASANFGNGGELNAGVSRNGFGAADGPVGHTVCWESSATENRGFQVATAADALLQLQTLTMGVFFKLTAANNGPIYLGRQNGIYISVGSAKKGAAVLGGGPTNPSRSNPTTVSLNTWHYLCVLYDGHEMTTYLDGFPEGVWSQAEGPFGSFANRVVFGGDTGQLGAGHRLSLPHYFTRLLNPGEIATIARLGLGDPHANHQANWDYPADSIDPLIAGQAAHAQNCMGCGGRRRASQGGYKISTTHEGDIACVGAAGLYIATPGTLLTSSSTDRELDRAHSRLMKIAVDSYTSYPSTDKPWGMDSAGKLIGTGITTAWYGGVLTGLGAAHGHHSKDPSSSYLLRMKKIMAYLRANQVPPGNPHAGHFSTDGTEANYFGGNGIFVGSEMMPGILNVWDALDATTKSLWLDTLTKLGNGFNTTERNFWPNGNYIMFYWSFFKFMAVLDPSGPWASYATYFFNYLFSPTGSSGYVAGTLTGVGVRRYVDGTATNDPLISAATMRGLNATTDKIYASEGNSATSTGPGNTYNTTYGFDPNYVGAQGFIALCVYLETGDTDAWLMAQLLHNGIASRQNFTNGSVTINGFTVPAWQSENRGTRHNVSEMNAGAAWHALRRLGRTDYMTAQQVADRHHQGMVPDAVTNTTQQNVWYRVLNSYAAYLRTSPYKV